ncbi:MAG: DoxX family protein [Bdellovibrionota bacterium]
MPNYGLLILRLFAGVTMLLGHGLPKLGRYSELSSTFPDPIGVGSELSYFMAVGAEVGGAVLLALGLFTRLSSAALFMTMAVAFFVVHGNDPFGDKELAFIYMGMFMTLFCTGPGAYAVQNFFRVSFGRFQWLFK